MTNMTKLQIIESIVDTCSQPHLEGVFAPAMDMPASCTKAEMISHCLNVELGGYGFETSVSPDKTAVFVNDENMSKLIDFFDGKGYQPVITNEHTERISTLVEFADKNKVSLLWTQAGLKRKYYYLKQYGFNGVNLYNLLNLNSANAATVALTKRGAATLSIGGTVALSWCGSLFFSTIDNYVPTKYVTAKAIIGGLKFGTGIPIRVVEWTANRMTGAFEYALTGHTYPTNATDTYVLTSGPTLKNLTRIKKPVVNWLINRLNDWNN